MMSSSRGSTSAAALSLCCVCLLGMAISMTVILSLISVYLPSKGDELAKLGRCYPSFAPTITQGAGAGPSYVASADFNKDGLLDLVVVNYNDGTISFARGNGNGTFQSPTQLSTGGNNTQPNALAIGDVNNNGNLDLVVVNSGASNVGVFLGNGDGTFSTQTTYSTGDGSVPLGLALKDLNSDGNLDLVVSDNANHVVVVFLGSSTGAFTLTKTLSTGASSGPYGIAIEDFNRDGRPDIAVSNDRANSVAIFRNTGSATFSGPTTYATGATPYAVVSVDLNKDEIFDLVTSNYNANSISVLLGNSDGTFKEQKSFSTGAQSLPYSLYYGDFNRDSNADIAVANSGANNLGVFYGDGRGSFRRQQTYSTGAGTGPVDLTVGDYNRDGRDDLISANLNTKTASVLLNNCS